MNFIAAIQHATIGYPIRRRRWNPKAILYIDNCHVLRWVGVNPDSGQDDEAEILGPDKSFHLQAEDLTAVDWETV